MRSNEPFGILVVEDEGIVAKDLQEMLNGFGYDAFAVAATADEAIARATERCPDAVLMDIRIKGKLDGIAAAGLLRDRFGVPVIYLTAHTDDATLERAKRTEPYGYLVKPVKGAELRSALEVSIHKHSIEKRLRENERWFSTTLRCIADAVVSVDLKGNVTFMNPAAEALTGTSANDALGRPVRDVLQLFDEEARALPETPLEQALRENRVVELLEARLKGAGGQHPIITDRAAPVVAEGQVLGAVMVFRDVTGEKTMRRQLEQADRLASLGTMAAGVAHELNNPLAVVVANAELVSRELRLQRDEALASGADQRRLDVAIETQEELRNAAKRVGRIVADLRSFSRPAAAGSTITDVTRAIEWAVRSTTSEFRHRARLSTNLVPVPPVRADEARLGQVFVNLLVNAAQAIPPGRADKNEVSVATRLDEGGRIVAEVRDTGTGMTDEVKRRIFEPFFTTKPVGLGTGLGLSICHGIVNSMGGTLEVESELGAGSIFRVTLPVAALGQPTTPEATTAAPAVSTSTRRGRILVVDDEDMVLRTIRRVLYDHEVVTASRGAEALEILQADERFDVILTDLVMPDMTGVELFAALRERHAAIVDRVVFLTGGAVTQKIDLFLRTTPNRRVHKPFDVEALRRMVHDLIDRRLDPSDGAGREDL